MSDGYKIYIDADFIPAQAENANTLDGKTAEEFALTSDVESLQSQIGDQSVADQISSAVSTIDASKWDYVKASCTDYADLDSVLQNLDALTAYRTIIELTITSGGELNTDMTAKNDKDTYGSFLGIPYLHSKIDRQYRGVKLICLEDNSLWNYIDSVYGGKNITKLSEHANIAHSWDGTTLTITSASGTSSADLKGEKGDMGELLDGSVTVEKLEETLKQDITDVVTGAFPPSKNLLILPNDYTKSKDGITVNIKDGLITVTGTATGNPSSVSVPVELFYIPESKYTLSAKNIYSQANSAASSVCLKNSGGTKIGTSIYVMESHINRTKVIDGGQNSDGSDINIKYVTIFVSQNQTVDQSFYLQLEVGETSTYYVPAGRQVFGGDAMTTVQLLETNTVLASMFGAVGDGVTDDTAALQEAVDYCSENYKMLQLDTGKTYLISKRLRWAGNSIYFDGNFATISAKENSGIYSLIQIDCEGINDAISTRDWESRNHRQQVVKNVILECNGIAPVGLEIRKGIKTHCTDITIKDPVSYGVYVNQKGWENFISNVHITRYLETLGGTGVFVLGSDNTFDNTVIIGCQFGIVNAGSDNHYSKVHPWSTTKAMDNLEQSICFDCRSGYCTFSQCMGDSTSIIFRLCGNAKAMITGCANTWAQGFIEAIKDKGINPQLFHFVESDIMKIDPETGQIATDSETGEQIIAIPKHQSKGQDVTVSACYFKVPQPETLSNILGDSTINFYFSNLTEVDTPMLIDRATTGWQNQPVTIENMLFNH